MESNNTCEKCRCLDGQCFNKKSSELLSVDPLELLAVDPLNLEYVDVEIPILNPRVNVNMEQELPSLENLDPLKEEKLISGAERK